MIQVDGLSYRQFKKALHNKRLPFLNSLINSNACTLKPFYSGMPSTTPAVQAELFFGKKTAVPAFEFFDRKNSERHAMAYPSSAEKQAEKLMADGQPLLKNGSSYSNIYTAGADEARYCIQTMKLESIVRSAYPFKLLLLFILYFSKIARIIGYVLVELSLSINDFFRGLVLKKNFFKELKFIPTRVFICIILREMIRFRVKLNLRSGVRIVHANLVGYDEQAHRRGPDSAFAHWSLKGIDDTIKDICRSSLRSNCRDYELIIYSDHGQEKVKNYQNIFGKNVADAIREILADDDNLPRTSEHHPDHAYYRRLKVWFNRFLRKKVDLSSGRGKINNQHIIITTMGPLGHVYFPFPSSPDLLEKKARVLVEKADIPIVLFVNKKRVYAVNSSGVFDLQHQGRFILGENHPFAKQVCQDLAATCRHPNAGDLVISGWIPEGRPLSFNVENGAHGGPGREETCGFILLPRSIESSQEKLRPIDLRKIVFNHLEKAGSRWNETALVGTSNFSLKVMSYNIHSCINVKRQVNPDGILKVIASQAPDIIALQEVDVNKSRTDILDQPRYLAQNLNMDYEYFPLVINGSEQYGLAVLTRYAAKKIKYERLPTKHSFKAQEPRGAMLLKISTPAYSVGLINTHLGLKRNDRLLQIQTLLNITRNFGIFKDNPLILCGDLNAVAGSPVYRKVAACLNDVQHMLKQPGYPKATFFSLYPMLRLDHIFLSNHFAPVRVHVPNNAGARMASDHLPVFAEIKMK